MEKLMRVLMWVVGIAVLLGVVLRLTILESWVIPDDPLLSASLQPTMGSGDTVLLLTRGEPDFGDLVRCPDPEDASRFVVGRIVGMPGDQVEIRGRTLMVNGRSFNASERCLGATFKVEHPSTGHETVLQCSRVEMGGGWHFRGSGAKLKKSDDKTKKVGEGKFFLLSDNRSMHDDSRDYGTVPMESCTERVVFRVWGPEGWMTSDRRMDAIR
jgi:signal peptidase I